MMSVLPSLPDSLHPSIQEIDTSEPLFSQLDHHKAVGPDHIPARVLKELPYDLTPMTTHLFNSFNVISLETYKEARPT